MFNIFTPLFVGFCCWFCCCCCCCCCCECCFFVDAVSVGVVVVVVLNFVLQRIQRHFFNNFSNFVFHLAFLFFSIFLPFFCLHFSSFRLLSSTLFSLQMSSSLHQSYCFSQLRTELGWESNPEPHALNAQMSARAEQKRRFY